jgi:MFS family permease
MANSRPRNWKDEASIRSVCSDMAITDSCGHRKRSASGRSRWLFTLLLFLWGFSGGMTFVAMVVGLLREAPAESRGRVMGIRSLGIYGVPLGLLLGGWIAEQANTQAMIGVLGGIGLLATLISAAIWPALLRTNHAQREQTGEDHPDLSR